MSVSEILFVVAGALLGLAFQGGMFLFLIPFAVVAFFLAVMNRPNNANTSILPVIQRDKHSTTLTPVVSPDLRNEFTNANKVESNEPNSSLQVNHIWERANSDVDKAFGDILRCLKELMPQANTLTIFTNGGSVNELRLRTFHSDFPNIIDMGAKITENMGILSQLLRPGVSRILEGDLLVGKRLTYYIENRMIRSLVGVPLLGRDEQRLGVLLVDSLRPNAFTANEAQALTYIAQAMFMVSFKSFASAQNYIEQQQFSTLYHYQRKFFQTMSVKDIYKQMFEYVKENMPFDRLTILALDKPKEGLGRVVYCVGMDSEQFVNKTFTLSDKGIFVLALMRNRPVFRSFNSGYADYVPRLNDSEKRNMELRQLFVMPVSSEPDSKTAELAICLESRFTNRYQDHEKKLLKAFAGVAGFAYARACQFEKGKDLATRDGLTGLMNHRSLEESLRTEKVRADRKKYNIGVLMMDIDHFKRVNDTYGHQVGDEVIKGIASAISGEIRKEIDVVARYGGEEFVVALIDTTPEGMIETAERIRKAVGKLEFNVHQPDPLRVTVSIGAFLVEPGFTDMKKAVNNADQALYKAKDGGRNQVVQFEQVDGLSAVSDS
ncbi:MAG: sensor domain-containing diguanylate cyclase [Fibrobacter sp.]|nr:sensor domain-containing diguanylate cyclase [Fibrobacter sp.]